MLHSFNCCHGDTHCHLRIGSSISVCTPTLQLPSPDNRGASSYPYYHSVSLMSDGVASLKASASDSCLETLADKKKVSFSSSVQFL